MKSEDAVKYAQMDLLIELRRICEKHGIDYFLVEGTLIGAIRHQGFIPWDDDIDVGMLRSEYDRFIKACAADLDPAYMLTDWNTDEQSPLPFMKLKIRGTSYVESLSEYAGITDGIYIDVFPFDNAPDQAALQKLQSLRNVILKKVLLLKCGFTIDSEATGKKKLAYILLRVLSGLHSTRTWKNAYEHNALKYDGRTDCSCVVSLGSAYSYQRMLKERSVVSGVEPHLFDGELFSVPRMYDRYLREVYGDYMKLPPEEERVGRHDIVRTDLGSYRVRFGSRG